MVNKMTANITSQVVNLLSKKGQIVTFKTSRKVKVKKGYPDIVKESVFQARIGCKYDNLSAVKEKRASGELPEENQGLPWGEWKIFPYVIEHKGQLYIRCTTLKNNPDSINETHFFMNGKEISKDDVVKAALASEFKKGSDNDVFNIKIDDILYAK